MRKLNCGNFQGGGGVGAGRGFRPPENSLDTVYLSSTYFTVNRGGPMVLLQRRQYCSKDPERVQYFPGGSNFFLGGGGRGSNANFYRNPYDL